MLPSSWSQSAATTALRKVHSELFRVKLLHEIPHWWILGRCAPPIQVLAPQPKLLLFVTLLLLLFSGQQAENAKNPG